MCTKHKLKITKIVDQFLMGTIYFKCVNDGCKAFGHIDRFWFYQVLKGLK